MKNCFAVKNIILLVLACMVICTSTTGQSLPKQCKVWLPEYIANTNNVQPDWKKSQKWQDWVIAKIKNNDFGTANTLVWQVYSDRANNQTYTESNNSSAAHSTLGFMEQLNIAEIRNDFALLYKSNEISNDLKISKDAQCFGWIPIDNLLLWQETPKTHSKIYQKALVIHDPIKHGTTAEKNPSFFLEPDKKAEINSSQRAEEFDIMFVLKTANVGNSKYYLLSRDVLTGSSMQSVYGWVSEEYITEWDQRLLLEPTYNPQTVTHYKSKNMYPTVFYEMDDAREFWTNEKTQNPLWKYNDFSTKRMKTNMMRFPILTVETAADIYNVAAIATLNAQIETSLIMKLEKLIEEFKVENDANNIEISIATKKYPYLQEQKLTEILRFYAWTQTDINAYITGLKEGGSAKITGYAPIKTNKSNEKLFDFVLFFSQTELEELIQQLSKINYTEAVSDAKAFQEAIIKMGQIVLTQFNENEIRNMDMDKLLGQIYGIPVPLNLCDIEIKKISNMDKEDLRDYIIVFENKLEKLKQISSDSNYNGRFVRNNNIYYWIPMNDMPGVYEDCNKLKIKN